ncbi:exo-alpha-sialidase [Streptomyces sp. NPDC127108]|uniref:exo-alpha-sialidase n=1 Tax=Streptomyces sp. NPDC127108 TaxID=3345361 RepID=UPI00363DFD8E
MGRASAPRIPSAPDLPGSPFGIGFAADGSGFALLAECSERRCRQRVAVLDRGAKGWRRGSSPLRDVTGDRGVSADLTVLGPGRALIGEGSERADTPGRTWFTGDGGRTWRRGTTGAAGTAAAVARGGVLVPECVERDRSDPNDCARERLLAVSPRTGRHHVLAHQPPLKGPLRQAGDVRRAGLFVSGTDRRTGLPALARSTDRGRTWQRPHLTGVGAGGAVFRVVAGRGGLYATQQGPVSPPAKNGLVTMHVSKDEGLTWTRLWKHRKGVEPRTLVGDLLVADDSSLTVHGEDGGWRSTDGARTFGRVTARSPAGSVVGTPVGWLWRDSFGGNGFRISTDGVHWRGFRLGRGD